MNDAALISRIERAIEQIAPRATIQRVWPLLGGNSANVQACEVALPDGQTRRFVIRIVSDYRRGKHANAAWREFATIGAMYDAGIPVPRPCLLESLTDDVPAPFYVLEFAEGAPELAPADRAAFLSQSASCLASVHRAEITATLRDLLPPLGLSPTRERVADANRLRVHEILAALGTPPSEAHANLPTLCHGDFWPGNLLWRDGELVAVLDWEEAAIGEPLFDVAIARLDLMFILDAEAAEQFTQAYGACAGCDLHNLPYWDLIAALRPIARIEKWAEAYPHLGRSDVTTATMIQAHQAFVARALAAWPPAR